MYKETVEISEYAFSSGSNNVKSQLYQDLGSLITSEAAHRCCSAGRLMIQGNLLNFEAGFYILYRLFPIIILNRHIIYWNSFIRANV